MQTISRDRVKRMIDRDEATVVEVLDEPYFRKFHLPGAINVPVSGNFERAIQQRIPDKDRPIVVYCQDEACPASPEAARKLDALGYRQVFDYEAGKEDWRDAGMPVES